jgi:hypothetical protein
MSKKYVPSFLKGQTSLEENKFSPLSDDYTMKKPIVNTSLPAKEAPKLAPATLASITSANGAAASVPVASGTGGSKRSFAAKFAEQAKIASDPNYKPPAKPINFESEADFPTLGGPKKAATGAWGSKPKNEVVETEKVTNSFAAKAKDWAKTKEEEAEMAHKKAMEEAKRRKEAELVKKITFVGLKRNQNYNNEDDEDYNQEYDETSLGDDSDGYEVPEGDEPSEEEDDEEEFNQNIGWDGRHKDDLY